MWIICNQCGTRFYERYSRKYCTRRCRQLATSGPKAYNFKGGYIDAGYRQIYIASRRIREHRYVMEQMLGRPLKRHEHVHHKDGNKLNNNPANLEVLDWRTHTIQHIKTFRNDTHKQCAKCREIKPRTDFHNCRNQPGRDPNHSYCKRCRSQMRSKH